MDVGTVVIVNAWGKFPTKKMKCIGTDFDKVYQKERFCFDNGLKFSEDALRSNCTLWSSRNGYRELNGLVEDTTGCKTVGEFWRTHEGVVVDFFDKKGIAVDDMGYPEDTELVEVLHSDSALPDDDYYLIVLDVTTEVSNEK